MVPCHLRCSLARRWRCCPANSDDPLGGRSRGAMIEMAAGDTTVGPRLCRRVSVSMNCRTEPSVIAVRSARWLKSATILLTCSPAHLLVALLTLGFQQRLHLLRAETVVDRAAADRHARRRRRGRRRWRLRRLHLRHEMRHHAPHQPRPQVPRPHDYQASAAGSLRSALLWPCLDVSPSQPPCMVLREPSRMPLDQVLYLMRFRPR